LELGADNGLYWMGAGYIYPLRYHLVIEYCSDYGLELFSLTALFYNIDQTTFIMQQTV